MKILKRLPVLSLQKLQYLSAFSVRLTKITGKSKYPIHPKHLIKRKPWYLNYLQEKDKVLDMGCGTGQHSINISPKVKNVVAFDISKKIIEIAAKRAIDQKIKNIQFEIVDAEKSLPYRNNFFSSILCLDVLEHLKNEDLAMREIKRVLKPYGKLFLSLPNRETSWKKLQKSVGLFYYSDKDHKREYTKAEIKKLCRMYNFEVKFIKSVVLDTPLAPVFDLVGGFSLSLYSKLAKWKQNQIKKNPQESVGFQIYAINQKSLAL